MSEPRWPPTCPSGRHRLLPGELLVGWHPCDCTPEILGHRTWTCVRCLAAGRIDTWFDPPCLDSSVIR
ncbi:hypothetical protein FHR81_000194 [Actinoalloteichus hoggarensis]|uniref:hypothetical protein n=1 Tax=Actinoalloteichus hoggarensis TaxID=1470176 RepID=UPI000B8AD361|nr:hypothetical protein [Actinoalloteichus hoggarensis]MBB5919165.1 hypothetical protein [Actinoalloteichus hoggarensis]